MPYKQVKLNFSTSTCLLQPAFTVVLILLFVDKPQFMCDTVMLMPLHREDVNITCRVRADPPIFGNMTEMYWKRISSGNDTILPGASLGQFTAYLEHGVSI